MASKVSGAEMVGESVFIFLDTVQLALKHSQTRSSDPVWGYSKCTWGGLNIPTTFSSS